MAHMQGKCVVIAIDTVITQLGIKHILGTIKQLKNAKRPGDIPPILDRIRQDLKDFNLDNALVMEMLDFAKGATDKLIHIQNFFVKLGDAGEALKRLVENLNSVVSAAAPNPWDVVEVVRETQTTFEEFKGVVDEGKAILE